VAARDRLRHWRLALAVALGLGVVLPVVLVALYGLVPPPITGLMVVRLIEGEGLEWRWVALEDIAPVLPQAVVASEDNRFCIHHGFDWKAVNEALDEAKEAGEAPRGASTITQQTAKNLFLWPGRSYVRKGLEAYFTVLMEALWSKRRIIEVYLNVAEWGPGLYGAEAAARAYFKRAAAALTRRQAALMAVALPNPRKRNPAKPSKYLQRRARVIEKRIRQLGPLLNCVRPEG
jgi:monofunctional biosynthetic peptidoglycan transglycosylase